MLFDERGLPLRDDDNYAACADQLVAMDYSGEFILFPRVDPAAVRRAALAGFMPMSVRVSTGTGCMILFSPKLHLERCLIDPAHVKPTRSAVRAADPYRVSLNTSFRSVLDQCVKAHGDGWLTTPLTDAFASLAASSATGSVRWISVELYRNGGLVAGEFGYLVGSCYASLSGFTTESGAGTVQLYALAAILAREGVQLWDLGMEMPYKLALGARPVTRSEFLPRLREAYRRESPAFFLERRPAEDARPLLSKARVRVLGQATH